MVKLSGAGLDRWLGAPDGKHRAVLFYGPNEGLVRDRARAVVAKMSGGNLDDPFGVFVCDQSVRGSNPAALIDETFSISMMGGEKVIWVREAADSLAADFATVLDSGASANFMVVEAGDLKTSSKLRKLFEASAIAVAAGCYLDDQRSLVALAGEHFRAAGVTIQKDALDLLVSKLGQDRLANLAEIEKLSLLAGEGGTLDAETVLAAIGDGMADVLEDCIYAVFDGRRDEADRQLVRVFDDGFHPAQFSRRLLGHVDRLIAVRGRVDRGEPIKAALGKLQPRIFFKFEDRFSRQVSRWAMAELVKIQDSLVQLEIECKSTGSPALALCQRAALSISGAARRHMN